LIEAVAHPDWIGAVPMVPEFLNSLFGCFYKLV
jgi:hypothetical protein